MASAKEKSLPLAIGLNLLLPGLGYLYMGRWIPAILAFLIIGGILLSSALFFFFPVWLAMNAIMAIDMFILFNKNKKNLVAESTKKCPNCAEIIQREAKICRFCGTKFDTASV